MLLWGVPRTTPTATPAPGPRHRPRPHDPFPTLVEAFLWALGTTKPSPHTVAAYRRDLLGVGARMAPTGAAGVGELRLGQLTKGTLRAGFASWASDHAAASVLRAHSAWSAFFDYLVAEDLAEGSPMAAVRKPKAKRDTAKVLRASDAAARLLATARAPDPHARQPWPER